MVSDYLKSAESAVNGDSEYGYEIRTVSETRNTKGGNLFNLLVKRSLYIHELYY